LRQAPPAMPLRSDNRFYSLGKIWLGVVVALSVVVAALLSASPALHEQVHPDSAAASHLCVVTLFGSGHCASATAAPVFVAPTALPTGPALLLPCFALLPVTRVSSVLEHAPPVSA